MSKKELIPFAAVDVETYPSGGYGTLIRIDGSHSAYGETVTEMHVRHRHGFADYARKACDVGRLLGRVVRSYLLDHGLVSVDDSIGMHPVHVIGRYHPAVVIEFLDLPFP